MNEVQQSAPDQPQRSEGRPRRRWGPVVLGVVAAVLAVLWLVGTIAERSEAPRWDGTRGEVILDEDFGSQTTQFSADSDRSVDLSVANGEYRVTIRDSSNPQLMRSLFPHSYPEVRFDAIATLPVGESHVVASVGCWVGNSGYIFLMLPNGRVGILETVDELTGERRDLTELVDADGARPPGEPNRLRIDCVGGGGTDATVVSGYVNGHAVLSVADPDGYDSFNAVGFWVASEQDDVVFTFDDAVATSEPGRAGISPSPVLADASTPGSAEVSRACDAVFDRAQAAFEDGEDTAGLDILGLEVPKDCADLAEAEASAVEHFGANGDRGLGRYLARSCASAEPSAAIRGTDLCREVLAAHPELT